MNLSIWIPCFVFAAVCLTFVFLGGYLQGCKDTVKNIIKFSEMTSKLEEASKENGKESH